MLSFDDLEVRKFNS